MTMSSPHPICVPLAALLMLCGASCKKPYTSETSQAPSHAAALCAGVEAGEPLRTCEELCTPRPASLECLVARRIGQPGLDALEQARAVPGEQRRAIYARVEGLPPMVEAYELGPWRSGPERAKVAEGREALGRCEVLVEDRPEESQRLCAQGVSQIEGILGKEHPMSAQARVTEALLHTRGERRAETLRAEREVLAALLGQDHPRTLAVEVALARARLDEVIEPGAELLAELEELAQAREIFFGDESAELHEALVARGVARMRAGQLERARQDLERADALLEAQGEPGYDPARLRAREPWAYVAPPAEVRAWAERAANAPDVPLEARAQVRMIAAQGMAHGGDLVGAQGMLGALQGRVDGAQSEGSALALRVRRARLDLARHAADWEAVLELSSALEAAGGSSPEDRAQALEAWLAGTEALTHLSRIERARERLDAFLNLLQQRGQSGQLTATELRQTLPHLTSRALALEEYDKAVVLEQEALALADKRLREGNTETLVRVASLARTLGRVGRARQARDLIADRLAVKIDHIHEPSITEVALAPLRAGVLIEPTAAALPPMVDRVAGLLEARAPQSPEMALAHATARAELARHEAEIGRWARARERSEAALEQLEVQSRRPEVARRARASALAHLEWATRARLERGELEDAARWLERRADLLEAMGLTRTLRAESQHELAAAHAARLGQLEPAREAIRARVELVEGQLDKEHPRTLRALNEGAARLALLGDEQGARALLTRAQAALEGLEARPGLVPAHEAAALARWRLGDLRAARASQERALELREQDTLPWALGRCQLSAIELDQRRLLSDAIRGYDDCLEALAQADGPWREALPGHLDALRRADLRGIWARRAGRLSAQYQLDQFARERRLDEVVWGESPVDLDELLEDAERRVGLEEPNWRTPRDELVARALLVVLRVREDDEDAETAPHLARALELAEQIEPTGTPDGLIVTTAMWARWFELEGLDKSEAADAVLVEALAHERARFEAARARTSDPGQLPARLGRGEHALRVLAGLGRRVGVETAPRFLATALEFLLLHHGLRGEVPADGAALCDALRARESALLIHVRAPGDDEAYMALTMRPDAETGRCVARLDELGPARRIEARVEAWRAVAEMLHERRDQRGWALDEAFWADPSRDKVSGALRGALERLDARGEAVRELIWAPLAARLGEHERVLILPDGMLRGLPLGALPDGEDRYLLEQTSLSYLPSLATLGAAAPAAPAPESVVVGALELAEPSPSVKAARAIWKRCDRERCVAPGREARQQALAAGGAPSVSACRLDLGELSARPDMATDTITTRLAARAQDHHTWKITGGAAIEPALRELLPGKRALHLDTPALAAAPGACAPRDRALEPGLEGAFTRALDPSAGLDPLRAVGLALPGAPGAGGRGPSLDGVLTGRDIARMDLGATELVVLPASGLIEGRALTLAEGFLAAGATSAVVSLWQPDPSTQSELVRLFYAELAGEPDPLVALHGAQRDLIKTLREAELPHSAFLWAGFVPVGAGLEVSSAEKE